MATDTPSDSTLAVEAMGNTTASLTPGIAALATNQHQTDTQMVIEEPPLINLPGELLMEIVKLLPTTDFSALRLTCQRIEKRIFDYWASSFMQKKQFSKQPSQRLVSVYLD